MIKVGIPRGLLFYDYGSLWSDFFTKLGVPTITSSETTKKTLTDGTNLAIDESCLPLKIFLGHVHALLNECTHIFVPRIAQHHKDYYYCAKFAGLPDIVRNSFNIDERRLISPNIESKNLYHTFKACREAANCLDASPIKSYLSYLHALHEYKNTQNLSCKNKDTFVAVVGHSYLLHEPFFIQEIKNVLSAQGMKIATPDQVPPKTLYELSAELHPEVYWQLSAKIVGAAQYFCALPNIKGILVISSFGCGPDSLINEYIDNLILKPSGKPYTFVNLDEHTGNAGIVTRVEAFLDLIEWRQ
ncbi:MAG: acyl-CoA dehydratase activase-related protein [Negativicutes bacterium]|nr:acyl-CoA dehydratase activase-related protein [Negativicutes bacterium]